MTLYQFQKRQGLFLIRASANAKNRTKRRFIQNICSIVCEYYVIGNLLLHKYKECGCDCLFKHDLLSTTMKSCRING